MIIYSRISSWVLGFECIYNIICWYVYMYKIYLHRSGIELSKFVNNTRYQIIICNILKNRNSQFLCKNYL